MRLFNLFFAQKTTGGRPHMNRLVTLILKGTECQEKSFQTDTVGG